MIRADAWCENRGTGVPAMEMRTGNKKGAGRKVRPGGKDSTGQGNDVPDRKGERQRTGRYGE